MKLNYAHSGNTYEVDTDDIGLKGVNLPDGVGYLLTYGFRQSLQDSIAGRAKKVRDELIDEAAKSLAGEVEVNDQHRELAEKSLSEDIIKRAVEQDLHGALMKRRDAIQAGTVKVGGQGSRDPFGTACWNFAADMVVTTFKTKYGKGPKRDDAFEALVEQCLTKHKDHIEKEVKRHQAAAAKIVVEI